MARDTPLANEPCPRRLICPPCNADCTRSALLARLRRKRGEVVRTRTTLLQAHTHQWMGTFSGEGLGDYRGEVLQARKRDQHLCESPASSHEPGRGANVRPIWR